MRIKQNNKGFTLIELLIVIAVIAILTTVVFVALNPLARFQDARNSRRWTDVNAIMSAVKLYQVDNKGYYPPIKFGGSATQGDGSNYTIKNLSYDSTYQIGGDGNDCNQTCDIISPKTLDAACINLDVANGIVSKGYMPSIPIDPSLDSIGASSDKTKYYIRLNSNDTVTVGSCGSEDGSAGSAQIIEVSR